MIDGTVYYFEKGGHRWKLVDWQWERDYMTLGTHHVIDGTVEYFEKVMKIPIQN